MHVSGHDHKTVVAPSRRFALPLSHRCRRNASRTSREHKEGGHFSCKKQPPGKKAFGRELINFRGASGSWTPSVRVPASACRCHLRQDQTRSKRDDLGFPILQSRIAERRPCALEFRRCLTTRSRRWG